METFTVGLGALCEDVGVPLSQFPAMAGYIRYVLLSETIDAEDLLAECRRREKILFEQLAKTDDERDLINQSRYMTLVEKLLDFSLTPDEWADYEQVRVRGGEGVNLEPYESFYRQAHARDSAMAENFLGALEKNGRLRDFDHPCLPHCDRGLPRTRAERKIDPSRDGRRDGGP
jgi:hypothetical protein